MKQEVAKLDAVKQELESTKTELEVAQSQAAEWKHSNEKLTCELQSVHGRLEADQMTIQDLRIELEQATARSTEMMEEVDRLRREERRLLEEIQTLETAKDHETTSTTDMVPAKRTAEAEATIAMLQQELADANLAIRELKETLKSTVEEQSTTTTTSASRTQDASGGVGGMPLFYAMEKQAELTQARNEIARLAALVGDSESKVNTKIS